MIYNTALKITFYLQHTKQNLNLKVAVAALVEVVELASAEQ